MNQQQPPATSPRQDRGTFYDLFASYFPNMVAEKRRDYQYMADCPCCGRHTVSVNTDIGVFNCLANGCGLKGGSMNISSRLDKLQGESPSQPWKAPTEKEEGVKSMVTRDGSSRNIEINNGPDLETEVIIYNESGTRQELFKGKAVRVLIGIKE